MEIVRCYPSILVMSTAYQQAFNCQDCGQLPSLRTRTEQSVIMKVSAFTGPSGERATEKSETTSLVDLISITLALGS